MPRHVHADLIHAWAEGAEIELRGNNGEWIHINDGSPSFVPEYEYRIKPKEPEWWENIPEHGLLVRRIDTPNSILIIHNDDKEFFDYKKYWTPLTNEEIEMFKR